MFKSRRTIAVLASVLAWAALTVGASTAAAKTVHFRNTLVGAEVASNEAVYQVRGLFPGAAVQFIKANAAGTGGTYTNTSYFGVGTVVAVGKYTASLGKNGLVVIHSHGRFVRGTGLFAHVSGKFTATGTLDPKTDRLRVALVGTETY
jgi:hypothetical protein